MRGFYPPIKQPLYEKVSHSLRRDILLNRWKKGEYLNETVLAAELQTSRGPIRDALKLLNNEGIVETHGNGRTSIVGFSRESFMDWSKMRFYLEKFAIYESATILNRGDYHYEQLERIVDEANGLSIQDIHQHIWADLQFHSKLVEMSQNRTHIKLWRTLSGPLHTLLELIAERYNDIQKQNEMHYTILELMKENEVELAVKQLEFHISEGEKTILKFLDFPTKKKG